MVQTCRWNSPHFSGYLYINRSWFYLLYTFIALHSVPSCAESDHWTFISPGYLVFSDKNQFIIQYLTLLTKLMDFFMKILKLNGNREHLLLSSMIVNTFIGILFPVYIYRMGMRKPSGTPLPSLCHRYPPGLCIPFSRTLNEQSDDENFVNIDISYDDEF